MRDGSCCTSRNEENIINLHHVISRDFSSLEPNGYDSQTAEWELLFKKVLAHVAGLVLEPTTSPRPIHLRITSHANSRAVMATYQHCWHSDYSTFHVKCARTTLAHGRSPHRRSTWAGESLWVVLATVTHLTSRAPVSRDLTTELTANSQQPTANNRTFQ